MHLFSHKHTTDDDQRRVVVDASYQPDTLIVPAGQPVTLLFHRLAASPCAEQVLFPHHGIRKQLARHQDVTIDLPASEPGEYEFHCGMGMLRGRLIVR
jgi:plastocyanin domain-containing protein